jgi:asparagine synthase (glutamine-hydrolysing)
MCGIAGWVDFGRDLRTEEAIARAMTASMALRGPDDEGLWTSENAAIGHRRLAVIDVEGGRQPMVAEGNRVLTYSGEVYNYRELRAELESKGHQFRTASDTEVVLRGYLEWGEGVVDRLNGMFAFAIWDETKDELLLVRDRIGVKPLYFYPLPDGVLFGSEPKAILANPEAARKLSQEGLCDFLILMPNPPTTLFEGLYELRPGHTVKVNRDGVGQQRCYWAFEARPHEDDFPTTVATVRELLEDIIERQLVSDVPLCMLLSGGLDSSVLTGLAKRAVGDEELRTFSVDFEGHAESFTATEMREAADGPFAHEMAARIGSTHEDIVLHTETLMQPAMREAVMRAWDLPFNLADMDVSLYLLFSEIREHSTVAISGEAADELFGGYPWFHDEEALGMPIFPWMAASMKRGAPPPFSLFSTELGESIKLGEHLFATYDAALEGVPRLEGEEGEQARMREVSHFHLTRFLRGLLDRKDRSSMATGLEVRVPFCDHRLMEYVFNVPWSMKKAGGEEKGLLKRATEDLLPQSILDRRKAIFPATQDVAFDLSLRSELKKIVEGDDDSEPIRPLLNMETAREVAAEQPTVEEATSALGRLRIESVLRMNLWLKEYDVDVSDLDLSATAA